MRCALHCVGRTDKLPRDAVGKQALPVCVLLRAILCVRYPPASEVQDPVAPPQDTCVCATRASTRVAQGVQPAQLFEFCQRIVNQPARYLTSRSLRLFGQHAERLYTIRSFCPSAPRRPPAAMARRDDQQCMSSSAPRGQALSAPKAPLRSSSARKTLCACKRTWLAGWLTVWAGIDSWMVPRNEKTGREKKSHSLLLRQLQPSPKICRSRPAGICTLVGSASPDGNFLP